MRLRLAPSRTATILLTGFGDEAVDAGALEAGAKDYLSKNQLTPESLSRSIRYSHQDYRRDANRTIFRLSLQPHH